MEKVKSSSSLDDPAAWLAGISAPIGEFSHDPLRSPWRFRHALT